MQSIKSTLRGIYEDEELRSKVVPLFMGKTGIGKTHLIYEFAAEVGAHVELFLTSSKPPFEIDGIGVPNEDRTKAVHIEFENILKLKDGDILFFDEMPNGLLPTLNASLTFLESRITAAGRKLPKIMIVAAGNYTGMTPMTDQIKERFVWYDVKFDKASWQNFMKKKYQMPNNISTKLCKLIEEEDFTGYNYNTPRSLDKAVNMMVKNVHTPYSKVLKPILDTLIENTLGDIELNNGDVLTKNEHISWLKLKQLSNGTFKK
jgi:MoxR-like ATPase